MAARAFPAMGTMVSLRLDGARGAVGAGRAGTHEATDEATDAALAAVTRSFARWEARCSLFDEDSELSRVGSGELALTDASEELRGAYELALHWRSSTGGEFTPHRGDGVIDLNGVVKALAIAEAGTALEDLGHRSWGVDAGGDVLVSALGPGGAPWRVGIVDPGDRRRLVGAVDLASDERRRAVATSGSAERGDHIWTRAGDDRSPFLQVSVAAADIVTADVLATAIVAGGRPALDEFAARFDIDVLAVLHHGLLLATPGWPRAAA